MTAPILAVPVPPASPSAPVSRAALAALLPLAALAPLAILAPGAPALAGPVLCTTTLEAPPAGAPGTGPVEVTRCGVTSSAPEVMERRYYSFSPPFAQGINLMHQITDALGLSIPGRDGGKIVAFGFPDQNIVWDGTAVENTYSVMVTDQSPTMPLRTSDIGNGYGSSLGSAPATTYVRQPASTTWSPPIRGLW
ncbi:MAG: Occludin/ELL family protein [Cyanobium sp. CACIAM 14]|nr:MAG: Occludin/ELL family protein [Cyanobium sp. CACIAM 14]